MGGEGSASQITGIAVISQQFLLGVQMYCTEVGGFFVAFFPPPTAPWRFTFLVLFDFI